MRGVDEPVQAQCAQRPQHRRDMAMGERAHDVEGVVTPDQRFVLEQSAQGVDFPPGPLGEVGEGAFPDFAVLAPALAQEDGGGRVPVGDGLDVHGNQYS